MRSIYAHDFAAVFRVCVRIYPFKIRWKFQNICRNDVALTKTGPSVAVRFSREFRELEALVTLPPSVPYVGFRHSKQRLARDRVVERVDRPRGRLVGLGVE